MVRWLVQTALDIRLVPGGEVSWALQRGQKKKKKVFELWLVDKGKEVPGRGDYTGNTPERQKSAKHHGACIKLFRLTSL